ncbi:MAG: hypothetical protein ACRDL5_04245 [Solirubrobacteraceae bacterium]
MRTLQIASALIAVLALAALWGDSPAHAASCPTETFLSFGDLAYEAVAIPPTVRLAAGRPIGSAAIDEPIAANGCKRKRVPAEALAAGSIDPRVAVLVRGRPHTAFVIGYRCAGFVGAAYWQCLTAPLAFDGRRLTATSYPASPPPRGRLSLAAALGTARYRGRTVTVRRIVGVNPAQAVAISGQPSTAFLSPGTCPYAGFSNTTLYDNLLRCLRAPVWFTYSPPSSEVGGAVVARSDRPVPAQAAGASVSLLRLPTAADFVPAHHGSVPVVGRVADRVTLTIPDVPQGLYEVVISCPACASGTDHGATLFPAGSILVTAKPSGSLAVKLISYAIAAAFLAALVFTFRTRAARRAVLRGLESFVNGFGPRGPSRD